METTWESVHVGGRKVGAVVRRRTPTQLRTLVCLEPVVDNVATVEHDGDVHHWSHLEFIGRDEVHAAERESSERMLVDGQHLTIPADTLPASATYLLLDAMLAGCGTEAEFHLLDDAHPDNAPRPAHFSVDNPREVTLPDGSRRELGAVTLYVEERAEAHFYFDSHEVIASEIEDATWVKEPSVEHALEGLDAGVAERVRTFLA